MLKIRYTFRLLAAFLNRFKVLIFIGIVVGISGFFLIRILSPILPEKKVERIGLTGRYTPDNLPKEILAMIGEGLTRIDDAGIIEPGLAASWESSDKGKTWIFRLKGGVIWQDGKKVTSESVVYEFSDVAIERPDEKTIIFKLQSAYSPFPSVVSKPTFKKGLLGTGEWQVKKITLAGGFVNKLTVEKKDGQKIIFKFYPSENRTKLAFKLGEVDSIRGILNPQPLDQWKKVKLDKRANREEYVAIFLNTQDRLASEKNLRQALAYGIKKEKLGGIRAIGPISPASWVYNPQVKPYTYDQDKARKMISELPKELRDDLSVNLTTSAVLLPQAEQIAKDWEKIGIKTNVQVVSGIPSEFQALLAIFEIPPDPDQYAVWHSTQTGTNISKYQNPRIDKLLEDGRTELNLEERRKIYLDFQRFLVEDSPAIFLYHPLAYTVSRR